MVASLKPKVTSVVSDQLPSFLNVSAPNFIKFLENYYDWLESNGNPLEFVRNVLEQHDYDKADAVYKTLLEKGVLSNLPTQLNVDKSILINNIKEIFRRKGTEDSFQFFLNALFGEDCELRYGRDLYLKSSDSTYTEETVIAIKKPKIVAEALLDRGRIAEIKITENTSYYNTTPNVSIVRSSSDLTVNYPVVEVEMSGYIASIKLDNGGIGYIDGVHVTVTGECNVQAVITPTVVDGVVTQLILTNAGSGYKTKPIIIISGVNDYGSGATASCEWIASVSKVNVIEGSIGWSEPPLLELIGGQSPKEIYDSTGKLIEVRRPIPTTVELEINSAGVVVNATITNIGEADPYFDKPNQKWISNPPTDAILKVYLNSNKVLSIQVIDGGSLYQTPPTIIVSGSENNYFDLEGCRITQIGNTYATAIVNDVFSETINGEEYYIIKLQKEGIKGSFIPDSYIEGTTKSGILVHGIVTPIFNSVKILNGGSCYKKGQYVSFTDGGLGGKLFIEEVSHGSVDDLVITKSGFDYKVGEKIVLGGSSVGGQFEGVITTIDGIGAKVNCIMELDEIRFIDKGYGYQIGDTVYIYGGNNDITNIGDSKLAELKVTSISTSDNYKSLKILSGGSSYNAISLAIIPSAGSTSPLRQIRPNLDSYVGGVKELLPGTFTKSVVSGVIKSLNWTLTNPDLNDTSVSVLVNGAFANIKVGGVSSGAITSVTIISGGINYVDPVCRVISTSGKGAVLTASIDGKGIVTGINIIKGGSGYQVDDTIEIYERYGSGANVQVVIEYGAISSYDYVSRGEFREIDKYGFNKYKYYGGSGSGLELDLYYRPKFIDVSDTGKYYSNYTLNFSEGHGSGAILETEVKNDVITSLTIDNAGSGYTWCYLTVTSVDGRGFNAKVTLDSNGVTTGFITAVEILDGGYNYDVLDTINIFGDGINGAISIQTVSDGVIKNITVKDGGSHYHYGCVLTVNSTLTPSSNAVLTPIIEDGILKSVTIVSGGSGYSLNSTTTLGYVESSSDPDSCHVFKGIGLYTNDNYNPLVGTDTVKYGATGTTAGNDSPIWPMRGAGIINSLFQVVDFVDIWPQIIGFPKLAQYKIDSTPYGAIASVDIVSPGKGYYSSSERQSLTLTVIGDGLDAILHPVLKDGSFVDVVIEDGGQNYTEATIIITGGQIEGTPAILVPYIVDGVIIDISISNPGTGYYYGTSVEIDGDGVNARATVEVETGITKVEILDSGEGYLVFDTTIEITDVNPPNTIPGSGAVMTPIIEDGKIVDVKIINSGQGYHNPSIVVLGSGSSAILAAYAERPIKGITLLDSGKNYSNASVRIYGDGTGAKGVAIISTNSLKSVEVAYKGNRYSRLPEISVVDDSNFGAISSIKVVESGRGFLELPILTVESELGKQGEVVAFSSTIGKAKSIRFDEFSFGNLAGPLVQFPINCIVPENTNFIENEIVYVEGYNPSDLSKTPHAKVRFLDFDRNLLVLEEATDLFNFITENGISIIQENTNESIIHEKSAPINLGDVLVGIKSGSIGKILKMNRGYGTALMEGLGRYPKSILSSQSVPNDNYIKMSNNKKYQDFAYIIRTGLDIREYKDFIDKLIHIAGYAIFGDVVINTSLSSKIKLPVNPETGKAIYDIIVLYFSLTPGYMTQLYKDQWRIENRRIYDVSQSIAQQETELLNGITTNTTWPSEYWDIVEMGSGTYSLTSNTITVTKTSHGLSVGDKVFLDFMPVTDNFTVSNVSTYTFEVSTLVTGNGKATVQYGTSYFAATYVITGGIATVTTTVEHGILNGESVTITFTPMVDDFFVVKTVSGGGNNFTIETWSEISGNSNTIKDSTTQSGIYTWVPDVLTITIVGHGYSNGDEIYIELLTGTNLAGSFIIDSVTPDTIKIVLPMKYKTTSTSSTGELSITKYVSRNISYEFVFPWKNNQIYNMNDIIETGHNKIWYSKGVHVASPLNAPFAQDSMWISSEYMPQRDYGYGYP